MIITMADMRQKGMCSRGTRAFFKKWDLDYSDFLENGIDSDVLEQTGDGMALDLINFVKLKTRT